MPEADAEIRAGHDPDILHRHVGRVDYQVAGHGQAAEHGAARGHHDVAAPVVEVPARPAGYLVGDRTQGRPARHARVGRIREAARMRDRDAVAQDRRGAGRPGRGRRGFVCRGQDQVQDQGRRGATQNDQGQGDLGSEHACLQRDLVSADGRSLPPGGASGPPTSNRDTPRSSTAFCHEKVTKSIHQFWRNRRDRAGPVQEAGGPASSIGSAGRRTRRGVGWRAAVAAARDAGGHRPATPAPPARCSRAGDAGVLHYRGATVTGRGWPSRWCPRSCRTRCCPSRWG